MTVKTSISELNYNSGYVCMRVHKHGVRGLPLIPRTVESHLCSSGYGQAQGSVMYAHLATNPLVSSLEIDTDSPILQIRKLRLWRLSDFLQLP